MRGLGFALFLAGVVLSSWFAARPVPVAAPGADDTGTMGAAERILAWGSVAGLPFALGVILITVGGVVARRADKPRTPGETAAQSTDEDARGMLERIERAISELPTAPPRDCAPALHQQLDLILEDLVPDFLERRDHHVAELGLVKYAEMSSAFASAERSLARAWSALTDEAWEEVSPRLDMARHSIATAVVAVRSGP